MTDLAEGLWVADFVSAASGLTTPLTTESLLVLPLGATTREREERLRVLTRLGHLRMRAVKVEHPIGPKTSVMAFSHFEWWVV